MTGQDNRERRLDLRRACLVAYPRQPATSSRSSSPSKVAASAITAVTYTHGDPTHNISAASSARSGRGSETVLT